MQCSILPIRHEILHSSNPFFHFSGNSERRVHVFLRHLEKMSHLFFESEMTPPAHFQQKRPKKKIFQTAGGNPWWYPFPMEERDMKKQC